MGHNTETFIQQLEGYLANQVYTQALPLFKNVLLSELLNLPHGLYSQMLLFANE